MILPDRLARAITSLTSFTPALMALKVWKGAFTLQLFSQKKMHGKRCVQCHKKAEEKCDGCDATCCETHQYELEDKSKVCIQCFREEHGDAISNEHTFLGIIAVVIFVGLLCIYFAFVELEFLEICHSEIRCKILDILYLLASIGSSMSLSTIFCQGKTPLRTKYPQYDSNWSY